MLMVQQPMTCVHNSENQFAMVIVCSIAPATVMDALIDVLYICVQTCWGSVAIGNPIISVHFGVIQKLYKDENKHRG